MSVEFSTAVADDLVDDLEAWFCELGESPWSLFQIRNGEPFSLHGFFADPASGRAAWEELRQSFPQVSAEPDVREVVEQDWQNAYKAYLKPWSSRDLHWVPEWLRTEYAVPAEAVALYFDAGMAFGTGSHETTRLCAERLLDYRDAHGLRGRRIVDAGCGSGILALSAALLGADCVQGFDNDPAAVDVSVRNRDASGVSADAVRFEVAGLEDGFGDEPADLVLANIQADVLQRCAGCFAGVLKPGGQLVLSGVLHHEEDAVRVTFAQICPDLHFIGSRRDGEWCDLLLCRKESAD